MAGRARPSARLAGADRPQRVEPAARPAMRARSSPCRSPPRRSPPRAVSVV